jgi:4-amino-4-deoxy-L-arabinose transferase-like glycosyltransferase
MGDVKGYAGQTECHIYPYTVAMPYKLFGVHEYLGRLVSIMAFCGGAFFLYKLARKYLDKTPSLIALLFYTFNPYMFFYSRSFQPDSSMIFFSIAMLYYFSEWIDKEGLWRFAVMTLCAVFAFLIKVPAVCLGLPLLYLCIRKFKYSFIVQWKLYLFAVLTLVPVILYYIHSYNLGMMPEGKNWGNFKLSGVSTYIDPYFYYRIFYAEIFESCLIYIGGIFFVLGILFTIKKEELRYIHYWLLAIIISFFLGGEGTAWPTYHTITIIAPASLMVGYAISNSVRLKNAYKITGLIKVVLLVLFVSMIVSLPLLIRHKITGRYKAERLAKDYPIYEVGKIVDKIIPKNDLIVGCSWGGPEILYYSNRRGWNHVAYLLSIEYIEDFRRKGAKYLATTEQDEIDSDVLNYLKNKYEVIRSTNEYLIVKL